MPLIVPSVSHSTNVTTVAHASENVRELTWGKRGHAGRRMRPVWLSDARGGFLVEPDDQQSEDSGQKRRKIEKPSRVEVGHCQSGK